MFIGLAPRVIPNEFPEDANSTGKPVNPSDLKSTSLEKTVNPSDLKSTSLESDGTDQQVDLLGADQLKTQKLIRLIEKDIRSVEEETEPPKRIYRSEILLRFRCLPSRNCKKTLL
jgi:hypothetical protein